METRFINDKQASCMTGLSVAWFQRARWSGEGPPYVKLGQAVRYNIQTLLEWFEARTVASSSQPTSKNCCIENLGSPT